MSGDGDEPGERETASVRLTFRTRFKTVQKLERIAAANELHVGDRPSVGAAINFVIDGYDEQKDQKQPVAKVKTRLKKQEPK